MASAPSPFVHVASTAFSPRSPRMWRFRAATRDDLAGVWREIQGCNDWNGLVRPLHPLLRDEIVRYGEFANVCYRAFDQDPSSKRYLCCKYGKWRLLDGLSSGYDVTKYIYAASDVQNCCSRWIGYVAIASDDDVVCRMGRRDIVVAFRGTVTSTEWLTNFMSSLAPARLDPLGRCPDIKVESGFLGLYTSDDKTCRFSNGSCREQALREVSRLIDEHRNEELSITLTGHSMGSSLAVLFGYDVTELGLNVLENHRKIPITVYSFAGPRVGNRAFKRRCEELGVKVLRVVNLNDPVTKVPGVVFNESFGWSWWSSCYAHLGVEVTLEFSGINDPVGAHDLDEYIGFLRSGDRMDQTDPRREVGGGGEEEEEGDVFDRVLQRVAELWPWAESDQPLSGLYDRVVSRIRVRSETGNSTNR